MNVHGKTESQRVITLVSAVVLALILLPACKSGQAGKENDGSTADQVTAEQVALEDAQVTLAPDASKTLEQVGDGYQVEYGTGTLDLASLLVSSDSEVALTIDGTVALSKVGPQDVSCTLSNASGSRSEIKTFDVRDTQSPEVSIGQSSVDVMQGDAYQATGNVTVSDPVDGAISNATGEPSSTGEADGKKTYDKGWYLLSYTCPDGSSAQGIDTSVTGTYQVKVDACDRNGNRSEGSFSVVVHAAPAAEATETAEASAAQPTAEAAPEPEATTSADAATAAEPARDFVLNTHTMKIHLPGCSSIGRIKESNRADVHDTLSNLEAQGYKTCKRCLG